MSLKTLLIITLAFFSFTNNFICNFDTLKELINSINIDGLLIEYVDNTKIINYLENIKELFIYIIFFINKDPLSIFKINIGV